MRHCLSAIAASLLLATPITALAADPATPHTAPAKVKAAGLPRTRDGHPDFGGVVWAITYITQLERFSTAPPELVVPEADAKGVFDKMTAVMLKIPSFKMDPETAEIYTASDGLPIVKGERRTRLIVSPADGKLPYTDEAKRFWAANRSKPESFDNPEDRPQPERCLNNGSMAPVFYMARPYNRQIVQSPGYVDIHIEYGDENRVIPFSSQHQPWETHPQNGDSIARWDGDTLVIETTNFPAWSKVRSTPSGAMLVNPDSKVIERFTRISATELLYQFTVEDPKLYSAPWLGEYSLHALDKPMYPLSCHEGNYAMMNILAGAREEEKAAALAEKDAAAAK
jgi:hypothetical protein